MAGSETGAADASARHPNHDSTVGRGRVWPALSLTGAATRPRGDRLRAPDAGPDPLALVQHRLPLLVHLHHRRRGDHRHRQRRPGRGQLTRGQVTETRRRARLARPAVPGPADDTAGHDRRHGRLAARLRPALPAHLQPGAVPLGAAGAGTAPWRGGPADRGVPDRRPAFRQRRPSPGIHSRRNRPADNRRLRDRGAHHSAAHGHNAPRRPDAPARTLNGPAAGSAAAAGLLDGLIEARGKMAHAPAPAIDDLQPH